MEVISSIDLMKSDIEFIKQVFSGSNLIQLKIESKSEFDSLMNSYKADMVYANRERIISLRGPTTCSVESSIFEDTALIISHLEDHLDVNLEYVTTLPLGDGKHITELGDFFQDTISVFASTVPFATGSQFRTPYGIVEHIKGIYCGGESYDKMSYMGMSYNVTELNQVWLGAEVCYSIMDMINEIYIYQPAGKTFSLPILLWLAEMREMGSKAYIALDTSNMDISSGLTIESLIQGV
jgi:hypothetical protein